MLNLRYDLGIWRSIPVGKLAQLLSTLTPTDHVVVSPVSSLAIMRGEYGAEESWTWLGYIDLADEHFESVA
jgi:hypothetical protein